MFRDYFATMRATIEDSEFLRRTVTVPVKMILVMGAVILVLNAAFLLSVKTQRVASQYIGVDVVASSADIAMVRAAVEENGKLIKTLAAQCKPPAKK